MRGSRGGVLLREKRGEKEWSRDKTVGGAGREVGGRLSLW